MRATQRTVPGWAYAPIALAVAYVVTFFANAGAIVSVNGQNADAIAQNELAKLMPLHSGSAWLGQSHWFSTLLFELLTRGLPFYRVLWEAAPYCAIAVAFSAVTWSAHRIAGRWAATTALALLVCANAVLLTQFGALNNHVLTWMSCALLFAEIVWVLDAGWRSQRSRWVPVAVGLGSLVALNLASDALLYIGGIVPALIAVAVVSRRDKSEQTGEALRCVGLTCFVAVVGSVIATRALNAQHIAGTPGWSVGLAQARDVPANAVYWWKSIAILGGSSPTGAGMLGGAIEKIAAALTLAAVIAIPLIVASALRRRIASADAAIIAAGRRDAPGSTQRVAFITAWGFSAILVSAAFVLSTAPVGTQTGRYLVGVVIAAAALAPVAACRRRLGIALVATAALVYCGGGLVSLAAGQASRAGGITPARAAVFLRFARAHHVSHGYAGYWDASPTTWGSGFALVAYPVAACAGTLCPFNIASDSAWYVPSGRQRSFLIVDTSPDAIGSGYVDSPPKTLGPPVASLHVARRYELLVYDYDIARRMKR